MFNKIKKEIDRELPKFLRQIEKSYRLHSISPLLSKSINDFVLRDGKRVRPILFVIGYKGFAKKVAANLYTSALAIELLHDFMLVHDDIIDKSDTRRGKPSMHALLNSHLKRYKNIKFNGQDLSIVVGDVMYAMAINAFLAIQEQFPRKEKALRKFIEAAMYTGAGEFIELLCGAKTIETTSKDDINKIYDYKTARYTFSTPLSTGAILAGANQKEIDKLFQFGIYLGRAFQIKDDIIGIFGDEKKTGKSTTSDLEEAKKTLLIWYAFKKSNQNNKKIIKKTFSKKKVNKADVQIMRKIIVDSGSLDYCKNEISGLSKKAGRVLAVSKIKTQYKKVLGDYGVQILSV
ncbi:polyprenyl synthetase family protein [Candidatus Omnitrophota bacterium]